MIDITELRKCIGCNNPMTERSQPRLEGIRQFQAHGRCSNCYQKALRKGELKARARVESTDTHIKCMKCLEWKPYSAYKTHPGPVLGYESTCRFCSKLWERYRLSSEDYIDMFESQGGKCAICTKELILFTRSVSIDHDHLCCPGTDSCGKCVRGLLCSPCNTGIGMFKDNPEILRRAAGYVASKGVTYAK